MTARDTLSKTTEAAGATVKKAEIRQLKFSQGESRIKRERDITTKSTKGTKWNFIVKFFVLSVYFVVGKYYNLSMELTV